MRKVRRLAAAAGVLLLGIVAAPGVGDEEPKAWDPVLYKRSGGTSDEVASVTLTTASDAEVVPRGGAATLRGTWMRVHIGGPGLRFEGPGRIVRLFRMTKSGLETALDSHCDTELALSTGAKWHAGATASASDPTVRGEAFACDRESFIHYGDRAADWIRLDHAGHLEIVAADPKGSAGQALQIAIPGQRPFEFRRDRTSWKRDALSTFEPVGIGDLEGRLKCLSNLTRIGEILNGVRYGSDFGKKPSHDGAALLFAWRKEGRLIARGQEALLRCPGDKHLRKLDDDARTAFDTLSLKDIATDLCSYAVRDFSRHPPDVESTRPQAMACDRQGLDGRTPHHAGGICVLFENGKVHFLTREDLGLSADAPIVVGPDSPNEDLQALVFKPR